MAIFSKKNKEEKKTEPAAAPTPKAQAAEPEEMLEDISYIREMKHFPGRWHQYDVLLAAQQYGWATMVDWAAYMETADLGPISTLTTAEMANLPEGELIERYRAANTDLKHFDVLTVERGQLAIGGISRALGVPIKLVWFNQTRVLRCFTLLDDEVLLTRYIETVIRRSFGTQDAMKLARPVGEAEAKEHQGKQK